MSTNDFINEILSQIKQPLWENWYIKEKIGSGAFSAVFKVEAQRSSWRTSVSALKIEPITADGKPFVDEERKKMYIENKRRSAENEAEIMYNLRNCPYIVSYEEEDFKELYIDGEFEGYYYLIRMEFLTPISKLIHEKKFDYSEKNIIKFTQNIGQGIRAAHKIGVIHRDIKLDNFFVDEFGLYKLGDFNISKKTGAARTFAGTQGYLAPEIYRAKSDIDAVYTSQADIYSFGICIYQLMNNLMFPFEDELDAESAIDKRMEGVKLPPPANASPEFSGIILKACEFDTKDRYENVDEMLNDINALMYRSKSVFGDRLDSNKNNDISSSESNAVINSDFKLDNTLTANAVASEDQTVLPVVSERTLLAEVDERNHTKTEQKNNVVSDFLSEDGEIEFGSYFTENENSKSPLRWRILSIEDDKALIISQKGIEGKRYNETPGNTFWENSSLRKWLNEDFYNSAFTDEEKKIIIKANLINYKNAKYRTENGGNTIDSVFLLSIEEAERLFPSNKERVISPTQLAKSRGVFLDKNGNSWWWLRSSGCSLNYAADVDYGGDVDSYGSDRYYSINCVRPALWISLSFLNENKKKSLKESFKRTQDSFTKSQDHSLALRGYPTRIRFGKYFESSPDSKSPINWQVLKVENDKALIITENGIDSMPFSSNDGFVTWDDSLIRKWLNSNFISEAFDESEKSLIKSMTITNPSNPFYGTGSGKITSDSIFLLSIDEAKDYFENDGLRIAKPTPYAKSKGVFEDENGNSWWWLRSAGCFKNYAADVDYGGDVDFYGSSAVYSKNMVRPAMWVDIKALKV